MPIAIGHLEKNLMFEVYLEVFYSLWVKDSLRTLKVYYWVSLFTISCPEQLLILWEIIGNLTFEVYFAVRSTTTVCPWFSFNIYV